MFVFERSDDTLIKAGIKGQARGMGQTRHTLSKAYLSLRLANGE